MTTRTIIILVNVGLLALGWIYVIWDNTNDTTGEEQMESGMAAVVFTFITGLCVGGWAAYFAINYLYRLWSGT